MSHHIDRKQPATIIVITGLPCTGKSTLAAQLQQQFAWPVLAKDAIKESLFDSLGWSDRAWSRRLSDASYELLFSLLAQVVSVRDRAIVEANFRFPEHTQRFAALHEVGELQLLQIVCTTDGELLQQRYLQRARSGKRHPGHVDIEAYAELAPQLALATTAATRLPQAALTIEWDTTQPGRDIGPLLERVQTALNVQPTASV
jgi:predicted kinase